MSTIGTFTKDGNGYTGTIAMLTVKTKATIRPVENKSVDAAPDFRVFAGSIEIGAGWSKESKNKNGYISVKLDDPSFPAAIFCRLVNLEDQEQSLLWSRK